MRRRWTQREPEIATFFTCSAIFFDSASAFRSLSAWLPANFSLKYSTSSSFCTRTRQHQIIQFYIRQYLASPLVNEAPKKSTQDPWRSRYDEYQFLEQRFWRANLVAGWDDIPRVLRQENVSILIGERELILVSPVEVELLQNLHASRWKYSEIMENN